MTQYEKLKAVFQEIGVQFEERSGKRTINAYGSRLEEKDVRWIHLKEGEGYLGFRADFFFTPTGEYVTHCIYE